MLAVGLVCTKHCVELALLLCSVRLIHLPLVHVARPKLVLNAGEVVQARSKSVNEIMSSKCEGSNAGEVDELTRKALEELTKEAKRGKERSDTMGVAGWIKPQMRPNKRFLKNTLLGAARQRDAEQRKHHTLVNKSRSRDSSQNENSLQDGKPQRRERDQGEKSCEYHRHRLNKRQSSSENDKEMYIKKKRRAEDNT